MFITVLQKCARSCQKFGPFSPSEKQTQETKRTFSCLDGNNIDNLLQNDLVSDCGPQSEDETELVHIIKHKSQHQCSDKDQIPCRMGHSKCLYISEICTFRLNRLGKLTPCRTGEHLHDCKQFFCNMMLKCPDSYCVPWSYVCDGKWDCPAGFEENNASCGQTRNCSFLFKCTHSSLCIHITEVCNGVPNCPAISDDEFLCELHLIKCPTGCQCLSLAMTCHDSNLTLIAMPSRIPHHAFSFKWCKKEFVWNILQSVPSILWLDVTNNNLESICKGFQFKHAFELNFGFNNLSEITSNCFEEAQKLTQIHLNDNMLCNIQSNSFVDLPSLLFLNLERNLSSAFCSAVIKGCPETFLNLKNNTLEDIDGDSLTNLDIEAVWSDDHRICCFTQCTTKPVWYKSCDTLISSFSAKISVYCFASAVVLACILSLILQRVSHVKSENETGAFAIVVVATHICDVLCATYLIILWATDLSYGNFFVLHDLHWMSNKWCFLACGISLNYFSLSPTILIFLAVSRLMVTLSPLDSSFKQRSYVFKHILALFCFIIALVILITVLVWVFYSFLSQRLCSPFWDPSDQVVATKVLTYFTLLLHLFALISILVIHVMLGREVKRSQEKLGEAMSKKKSSTTLYVQLIILTLSNAISWIPSGAIFLTAVFSSSYPVTMNFWNVLIIANLNSLLLPVVFVCTNIKKILK